MSTKQHQEREQINAMRRIFAGGTSELCFERDELGAQVYA